MSDIWNKVKSGTKEIAGKTNDAIESGKLKREVSHLRSKIEKLTLEVGKVVVEASDEGATYIPLSHERLSLIMEEIRLYKKKIAAMEQKLKSQ